ncbi:stress-response A/B barrel domain-containing protein UP3-like [Musa acuminata AAA Group]|uniref:stress-response A/B barrel domain-containing protein UP3-like n=1 Tax=Musa acuminata AAA Group TaxID=214697 RepID=UPI0031D9B752
MACLKTFPYVQRPRSPLKFPLFPSSARPLSAPRRRPFASASSAATMAAIATVEHVVLFKVRDSTDPSKVDAMVSNLRSLISLDISVYLAAGPVLRHRSTAASAAGFTHLLHSRYRSKADLAAYSAHPAHVAIVKEHVLPICDDIMAVDWVAELDGPAAPPTGSAVRLTLAKPKEGAAAELAQTLAEAKSFAPAAVTQLSYGENFSPARAKGFDVGFLAVFPSLEELDALDAGEKDLLESVKEKVRPLLESVIVLDAVVPPPPAASL